MAPDLKLISFFVILMCTACSQKKSGIEVGMHSEVAQNVAPELSVDNYVDFVKNKSHDLVLSKEIGDFIYTARFLPTEYLVLKELGNDTLNKKEFEERSKEMGELQYFSFLIQNKTFQQELLRFQLEDEREYFSRIEYFSFKMQDDIRLIDGKDTLACELFHFERTYDIAPYLTFTMAFKNTYNSGNKTFSFNDMVFKNGKINITFDKGTFTNIPKIKII